MPTCPECGAAVERSDLSCPACGASLEDGERRDGDEVVEEGSQGPGRIDVPRDPHELDVFEFSFKYPLANGYGPILLVALMVLGSFLLLPLILIAGYQYRVGRSAATGRSSPPPVEDFWGLLADGFRFLVAAGLSAIVVVGVALALIFADLEQFAFAWNFFAALALSAITPVFYGTGSVRSVYDGGRFLRFLGQVEFWIGYAYQLGILIVIYIAYFVIAFALTITLVGILLVPFLAIGFLAYASLVHASLWGRIYRDAAADGVVDEVREPDRLSSSW